MTWLITSLVLAQAAATSDAPVFTPYVDAFAEYGARWPSDGPAANTFSVPRVHAGVEAAWKGATARVLLEGVYSTQGGALVGVAGDSVVVRLREAWGGYRWRFLEAKLGMVRTLLVPELERAFRFRELTPTALESNRILAPADLGGVLLGHLPADYGWVGVSVTNGEGYASRELNPGKNVELVAAVHPLPSGRFWPVTLVGTAVFGSTGVVESATQRFGGAALWSGRKLGVSLSGFAVNGYLGDAARRGYQLEGSVRGELFDHLLLAARAQYFRRDATRDDWILEAMGAVGARVSFVEAFVAVVRTALSSEARAALPGTDSTDVRLVLRVRWPPLQP